MIIWKGLGILIPLIAWGLSSSRRFLLKAELIPDSIYSYTGTVVATAILIWFIGQLLKNKDGQIHHSLFFIPWSFWPIIVMGFAMFSGFSAQKLEQRAKKNPFTFAIRNDFEFEHAVRTCNQKRREFKDIESDLQNMTRDELQMHNADIGLFKKRVVKLKRLSKLYKRNMKEIFGED